MSWKCPTCALAAQETATYPPGPDAYCAACARPLDAQERLAAAVAELVRHLAGSAGNEATAGVETAAKILHTTSSGVYAMHARGKLPKPIGPGRRLVWRTADLLAVSTDRHSSQDSASKYGGRVAGKTA